MAALRVDHFVSGVQEKGKYKGRQNLKLTKFAADKVVKIDLMNPYVRTPHEGSNVMVANPDDPFCVVRLFNLFVKMAFPPGYTDRLFRRQAGRKELDARSHAFHTNGEPYYEANMKGTHGVVGKNQFSPISKEIARRCGFAEADMHTGRSNRRRCITKLAPKIAQAELCEVARHRDAKISGEYQEVTIESTDQRLDHTLYQPKASNVVLLSLFLTLFLSNRKKRRNQRRNARKIVKPR